VNEETIVDVTDEDMTIPILQVWNEEDTEIALLIEPHLEGYFLPPQAKCNICYHKRPDNTQTDCFLAVAYRMGGIVVYAPSQYAPRVEIGGVTQEPIHNFGLV